MGLKQYFAFNNGERMHQSLNNKTPDKVYASAKGDGTLIVDKYPHQQGQSQNRGSAVQLQVKFSAT